MKPLIDWRHVDHSDLPLHDIQEDPDNVREPFSMNDPEDAAFFFSVEGSGILLPIYVSLVNRKLTIIDGHRRYHVAKKLNHPTVPCFILQDFSERDSLILAHQLNGVKW